MSSPSTRLMIMMKESKSLIEIRKIREKDDKKKKKMTAKELFKYMMKNAKNTHKEIGLPYNNK